MKTIKNTTNLPLSISLPRGSKLHLGPRKRGQVSAEALTSPGVVRRLEAGEIEIVEGSDGHTGPVPASVSGHETTTGHHPTTRAFRTGDR